MARAAKGGQIGVNGDFYEGGKFLPRNPERPRQDCTGAKKARKIQIEPYVWIEAPAGFGALIEQIVGADYDRATKQFTMMPVDHAIWQRHDRAKIENLVMLFNRGERVVMHTAQGKS